MISHLKNIGAVFQRYLFTFSSLRCKMVDAIQTNIADMRIDYKHGSGLDTDDLTVKDPISLFQIWFAEAKNCERIEEANAMTLATSTRYKNFMLSTSHIVSFALTTTTYEK